MLSFLFSQPKLAIRSTSFNPLLLSLAATFLLSQTSLATEQSGTEQFRSKEQPLELVIQSTDIANVFYLDGRIEAINQGTISAQTSGVVTHIYGDVGDRVEAGKLLIEIDNTLQKTALAEARAALAEAKAVDKDASLVLGRNERLRKSGNISEGELDRSIAQANSAIARVEAAQAAVKQAQTQLEYTRVVAPYEGVISERFVEAGELVSIGQALMSGYDSGALRVLTALPQHLAKQYQNVDQLHVNTSTSNYAVTSATLFPYADVQSHSVKLRANLPAISNDDIIPGKWVKVAFSSGSHKGIVVPESAIIQRGELTGVYIKRDGRALLRQVRIGKTIPLADHPTDEVWVEVLAGLAEGDTIYRNALNTLSAQSGE
ncbi:MAG: efflux RND transporter periplasmic adaptor subunit [Oleibacter sp.]|nr:efflux RND transporter periplasmic adaptor subunit [Thalassolituus sp.]